VFCVLQEAAACRAIAARGVLLVSTAHGSSLSDLLANPELSGLVGGVKAVTLGDRTAVASNGGHKVGGTAVVCLSVRGSRSFKVVCQGERGFLDGH
jgi:stage III sporulation protein SpoIIIAA